MKSNKRPASLCDRVFHFKRSRFEETVHTCDLSSRQTDSRLSLASECFCPSPRVKCTSDILDIILPSADIQYDECLFQLGGVHSQNVVNISDT